ncbi:hypothetical protein H4R18_005284 [Coemansia javaensis]|uniref:Pentatricopeptide repeat-containing protein n=1 Tax=Coemansia javaensis TaxID=2761396 RepID=A0A9W8LDK7_9FUNG|nr:hypothetical protein H4R18_005284 [Coemansia javaensis]
MFLGDMWRYLSDGGGGAEDDPLSAYAAAADARALSPILRPTSRHYNIVLDVIGRDTASPLDELASIHRSMRMHGIQEDTVTFNTLLNACRLRGAWGHFRETEAQVRKRDEWGVTRMDVTTWCTLIQGYRECQDWAAVDRCVAEVTAACRRWHRAQAEGASPPPRGCVEPTAELWGAIINVYAARDMVPQMIASRQVMAGFGLPMTPHTFAPIFAALHRWRRALARAKEDAWPAISLALDELGTMRRSQAPPNAVILTNLALTVGLANRHADPAHMRDGRDERVRAKLAEVGGKVTAELESMLARSRDPNVYAALLNLGGRAGDLDAVHAVWRALMSEAQSGHARPLLTPLTLAAFMNALADCRRYRSAIAAFHAHAAARLTGGRETKAAPAPATPQLQCIDRPVYEAAIRAFARADQHRMCARMLRIMVASGIPLSALSVRHALLPPDPSASGADAQRYTRRWSLPIAVAREIWAVVAEARKADRDRGPAAPADAQRPVIVNDVAAQLIRVAAYARNTGFGEQVFEGLVAEAAHFGAGNRRNSDDDDDNKDAASGAGARFPAALERAPNVYVYTSMISLYCNAVDLDSVGRMWARMLDDGIEPNIHSYTSLITALHKAALRGRWRQSRESAAAHASARRDGMRGPREDSERGDRAVLSLLTSQDAVIKRVEDWLTTGADDEPPDGAGSGRLGLDVPLSTLLLRYHSLRIRDIDSAARTGRSARPGVHALEDVERAMRVCQIVEEKGLVPDRRFHAALADFFDACGDQAGAELVRERIDAVC